MLFFHAALSADSLVCQTNGEIAWDCSVPGAAHTLDELKARIQQCANRYLLSVRDEAGLETPHVAAHAACFFNETSFASLLALKTARSRYDDLALLAEPVHTPSR
jgi:hypothetical protein